MVNTHYSVPKIFKNLLREAKKKEMERRLNIVCQADWLSERKVFCELL